MHVIESKHTDLGVRGVGWTFIDKMDLIRIALTDHQQINPRK